MTALSYILLAVALVMFAHLAYDDAKELKVWDVEVFALFVLAFVFGLVHGFPTYTVFYFVTLMVFILWYAGLFPWADCVTMSASVLLMTTLPEAGTFFVVLSVLDAVQRLVRCEGASPCDTPFITEAFVSLLVTKLIGGVVGWPLA